MKLAILKFRLALILAVFVLSVSFFTNRLALAKTNHIFTEPVTPFNSPPEFVYTTQLSGFSKDIFQKVNLERRRKDMTVLRWNDDLADLAYDYSRRMAREGFFDHIDPDGNSVVERAENYGIRDWQKIGENLFECYGYDDPATVAVKGWLKSRTHRENIFDDEWTHTGIGVYKTREGEFYITQIFLKK